MVAVPNESGNVRMAKLRYKYESFEALKQQVFHIFNKI
jgi:hypothetical protein